MKPKSLDFENLPRVALDRWYSIVDRSCVDFSVSPPLTLQPLGGLLGTVYRPAALWRQLSHN